MIFLYVAIGLILIAILALTFFFFYTFVRNNKAFDLDETFFEINELTQFKTDMIDGIRYIETEPFDQVYTTSYDGLKLAGKYYKHNGEHKGTIILFHGYRSPAKRDFSCAVKMYRDFGLNVLMVDMRSHGDSQGKLITFGVKERHDVLTWTNFVIENYSKEEKIFYSGLSMGGATVLMATELDLPENVKGIVADCGFTSPYDIIKHVAKTNFKINGFLAVRLLSLYCRIVGKFHLKQANTLDAVKKCTTPILFIHGGSDNFVPTQMTLDAYEVATCKKRLCIVDIAGHGTAYLHDKARVEKELEDLINENI